jgi:hypothetical protein
MKLKGGITFELPLIALPRRAMGARENLSVLIFRRHGIASTLSGLNPKRWCPGQPARPCRGYYGRHVLILPGFQQEYQNRL